MSKKATTSSKTKSGKPSKFKPIDVSQLKCAFEMIDTNHDGKLNAEEMKCMLQKIGIPVNDQTVNQLLAYASKNGGDGLISEQDFLSWLSKVRTPKEGDIIEDLSAAFSVFDRDKNGFITRDELKSAMQLMGETLTDKDLDQLLKVTDHDKDGKINYEEFIKTLL